MSGGKPLQGAANAVASKSPFSFPKT